MVTLEQLLKTKNLIGTAEKVKSSDQSSKLLPVGFRRPSRKVSGNTCTYLSVDGNRKTARLVAYGSPSVARNHEGVTEVPVTLMHSSEHIHFNADVLMNLRAPEGTAQQKLGQQEVGRQIRFFKSHFDNLRANAIFSLLSQGAIYFDGDGNLLPDSSGAAISVTFGIPAGHKDQLNVLGAGDIISASWATAGTDITSQVEALKSAAIQESGYPLAHAFYGKNILGHLQGNDVIKEYLQQNKDLSKAVAGGAIPDGLLGLQWHPVSDAFFEDQDGTGHFWFGDDTVVFTPEPSIDWYEVVEGSNIIPSGVTKARSDVTALLGSNVVESFGQSFYAEIMSDPVVIKQIALDTFLPLLKVPKAIYIGDVTP